MEQSVLVIPYTVIVTEIFLKCNLFSIGTVYIT